MLEMHAASCFEIPDAQGEDFVGEECPQTHATLLREFLAANYHHLHRRLRRFLGDPDLASDSLHDAWLRLGDRNSAQMAHSPEAYVYRVACNLAIDRLRSNRAWQYASDIDVENDGFADPTPGPDLIAELRSEIEAVERVMQRLPRRHRAVLMAIRIDEMTRQEVASRYRLSVRGVDTALRQILEGCEVSIPSMRDASRPAREHICEFRWVPN